MYISTVPGMSAVSCLKIGTRFKSKRRTNNVKTESHLVRTESQFMSDQESYHVS
jgi:hypothetical protein